MNEIKISKYLYFGTDSGRFYLTDEAHYIICSQKNVICSYSGSNEWCNHFICELLDLYSGSSKYNYALGQVIHEHDIPEIWKQNKNSIIDWLNKSLNKDWFKKVVKIFDFTIDNLPTLD